MTDEAPPMPQDDRAYFQRRAEDEIELAQRASHRRAVQAHYELASAYLDRIHTDAEGRESPPA